MRPEALPRFYACTRGSSFEIYWLEDWEVLVLVCWRVRLLEAVTDIFPVL
jgi:hypothetical protein